MRIEDIARVCHEVNRAFCQAFNDNTQLPWNEAPQWQRESAINGVQVVRDNPTITPEEIHQQWVIAKLADGWKFGRIKDGEAKTHPLMIPYARISQEHRAKDYIFQAVVRTLLSVEGGS